jgi:hypothetical protein
LATAARPTRRDEGDIVLRPSLDWSLFVVADAIVGQPADNEARELVHLNSARSPGTFEQLIVPTTIRSAKLPCD